MGRLKKDPEWKIEPLSVGIPHRHKRFFLALATDMAVTPHELQEAVIELLMATPDHIAVLPSLLAPLVRYRGFVREKHPRE